VVEVEGAVVEVEGAVVEVEGAVVEVEGAVVEVEGAGISVVVVVSAGADVVDGPGWSPGSVVTELGSTTGGVVSETGWSPTSASLAKLPPTLKCFATILDPKQDRIRQLHPVPSGQAPEAAHRSPTTCSVLRELQDAGKQAWLAAGAVC
jgi:hypothetical protein